MLKTAALGLAGVALAATPLSAQMQEAELPDIYESYNDCFAATVDGIEPIALESRGWVRATINGEITREPMIFGHGERAPVILLMGEQSQGLCVVTARLSAVEDFDAVVAAWEGTDFSSGEATFLANGHPIQIARTGSHDEPSIRLVVGVPREN